MQQTWTKRLFLLLLLLSLVAQGAAAAEGKKTPKSEGKYKQISGEVVSIGQDSIVIKNKTKGTMTFAITKATDMIGPAVKAGDKAKVNYQVEQDKNRATRITVKTSAAKHGRKETAARSADASPAR